MSIRLEPATRHYDEKLQQILKTSAKIFAEKGFHHTSVRDISRATKMSLSGLYYYFATKEELLYLIQERCFVTLLQRWEQAVGADLDVRARIRAFAENHLSFFLHNMPEMKVMAHEDESLTGEFNEKILVLKRRYVKVLLDLMQELQEQEGAKGVDLRVATFALFGMLVALERQFSFEQGVIDRFVRIEVAGGDLSERRQGFFDKRLFSFVGRVGIIVEQMIVAIDAVIDGVGGMKLKIFPKIAGTKFGKLGHGWRFAVKPKALRSTDLRAATVFATRRARERCRRWPRA